MMNHTPSNQTSEQAALGHALRDLPSHTPDGDSWERIRAHAVSRQRRRRHLRLALPLAAAASVLLVLVLGTIYIHRTHQPMPAALVHAGKTAAAHGIASTRSRQRPRASLADLQDHSMRLEQWLAELRAGGAPLQGQALASAVALQNRIGLIDLQLSGPGNSQQRRSLWRQRIRLLQNLAMLRVVQSSISTQPVMAESRSAIQPL